jgi:TrmH family RNA methyltransferase
MSSSYQTRITSVANDKVRYARSLQRRRQRGREGRFLVEGVRLLEEALRAGCIPALLFYSPERAEAERASGVLALAMAAGVPSYEVSEAVLNALADTVTPQPIVAVVSVPKLAAPAKASLVLVLDRLRDPGNLGTILRTAVAAGVDEVLLAPGTVEPYNPKAVRAGMGAHFRLPMAMLEWPEIAERLAGLPLWIADAQGEVAYDQVDWRTPAALLIGGEPEGASESAGDLAAGRLRIPMWGETESLNAAAAAAVILFEAARQRRVAQAG